jgi:hypothetical protein
MLQRMREALAVLLLTLLPLHAFFVTVGTRLVAGAGQPPLGALALWKECVLAVILLLVVVELFQHASRGVRSFFRLDPLDFCILGLALTAVFVSLRTGWNPKAIALGVRYDFVPLITFFLVRRVEWSTRFFAQVTKGVLSVGVLVAVYGILTLVAPQAFFVWLGYSDLHSLYVSSGPVAAFQQIGALGIRRMQSTMSGPNQLGMWLLLPYALSLIATVRMPQVRTIAGTVIFGGAIALTFSRASWLAAAVITVIVFLRATQPQHRAQRALIGGGVLLCCGIVGMLLFPQVLLRSASTRDHILRPLAAVQRMTEQPFGAGLGAAGPAQNRIADTCVYLDAGADAAWAQDRPNLCVFVGDVQVQPPPPTADMPGRVCNCPFLPESWYLQIGVELGWVGLALFIAYTLLLIAALRNTLPHSDLAYATFLAFMGVSIGALVLHAWEDSAVAYTLALLAAAWVNAPRRSSLQL